MLVSVRAAFWISFAFLILGPLLIPKLPLLYFAPFLVVSYYKKTRFLSLIYAMSAGLLIDLFSSTPFFGITAINYSFISLFLYNQKRNFFEDKLFTLPLMTTLFSFLSSLFSLILLRFYGQKVALSLKWILTDLIGLSLLDSIYAFLFFLVPFQLTYKIKRSLLMRKR